MSWPTCPKSKRIIRIVEECERTIFGEENQTWSPRTDLSHLILVKRINKILEEIGHKEIIDKKKIYEKTRIIAHNLGVSFGMNLNLILIQKKEMMNIMKMNSIKDKVLYKP